jgi:hypothetical protein
MEPGILDGDTEIKDSKIALFQEKSKNDLKRGQTFLLKNICSLNVEMSRVCWKVQQFI